MADIAGWSSSATGIIGYDEVVMLGYRDSGMAARPSNENPESFAMAPFDEAVGRLVEVVRRVRPQVMVTYPEDQSEYPHPITSARTRLASRPSRRQPTRTAIPRPGCVRHPSKLYYTVWPWPHARVHAKFLELGLESPFDERWLHGSTADIPSAHASTSRATTTSGCGP